VTKTGRPTDRRQNWVTPLIPTPARDARAFRRALLDERQGLALCPPAEPLAAERTQLLQTALGSPRSPTQPSTSSHPSFSFLCVHHWCEDPSAFTTRVEVARGLLPSLLLCLRGSCDLGCYCKAASSNRSQARIKFRSRWAFPGARRGGDLVGYARAVVLGPRFLIVEEAAAIGKALSPLSVLSRSTLDHIVGVEELLLGAWGLRSRACEKASDEGDLEGSEVNLVAKSGAPSSSSVGSSQ
jgi:hypothetical protein